MQPLYLVLFCAFAAVGIQIVPHAKKSVLIQSSSTTHVLTRLYCTDGTKGGACQVADCETPDKVVVEDSTKGVCVDDKTGTKCCFDPAAVAPTTTEVQVNANGGGTTIPPVVTDDSTTTIPPVVVTDGSQSTTVVPPVTDGSNTKTIPPPVIDGSNTNTIPPPVTDGSTTTIPPPVTDGSNTNTIPPPVIDGSNTNVIPPPVTGGSTTTIPPPVTDGSTKQDPSVGANPNVETPLPQGQGTTTDGSTTEVPAVVTSDEDDPSEAALVDATAYPDLTDADAEFDLPDTFDGADTTLNVAGGGPRPRPLLIQIEFTDPATAAGTLIASRPIKGKNGKNTYKKVLKHTIAGKVDIPYKKDVTIIPDANSKQNPHHSVEFSADLPFALLICSPRGIWIHEWPTLTGSNGCIHENTGEAEKLYNFVSQKTRVTIKYPWTGTGTAC